MKINTEALSIRSYRTS